MDLDRFKSAWQQQDPGPERRLRERTAGIGRLVLNRDRMETAVAILLLPVFAVMFWKETAPLVRFGAVWTICALICVAARLRITRRRTPPLDPSLPVREFCAREIR